MPEKQFLSETEKTRLLELARQSIARGLRGERRPPADPLPTALRTAGAAFVSLHKNKLLRGCIGSLEPSASLAASVMENAFSAAFRDPRFPPLTADELPEIKIEISVLTPPVAIENPERFIVGRHGIVLTSRGRRAVFLPQVAPQQGWDRETALRHLAAKAGLDPEAWRDPQARLEVFEAIVFGE